MKKSTLFISLMAAFGFGQAQTAPAWTHFPQAADYANYDDIEVSTGVDSVGNVYTTGSAIDTAASSDIYQAVLVKYNAAGVQQWKQVYNDNDPAHSTEAVILKVDKAGNSYVCGYGRHGTPSLKDYMVAKYNTAGTQLWVKYWDGGQNEYDEIICATFDAAGNLIVGGRCNIAGTNGDDVGILKYDPAGNLLWSYIYNNGSINGEDRPSDITCDNNNNILMSGSSFGSVSRDMITIKLNSAGVNQWTNRVPHGQTGDDDKGWGVVADALGNSYVTGAVTDWITIKYDPSGNVLWTNSNIDGDLSRYTIKRIRLDRAGNPIIGGIAFYSNSNGGSNISVAKLSAATGATVWTYSYDFGGIDNFSDMVLDTSGNVYVGGYFEGPQGGDMSTSIISTTGSLIWNTTYSNPDLISGDDRPYQIVIDKDRNVILAGLSERRGSGSDDAVDIVTLKYSAIAVGINEHKPDNAVIQIYPNPSKGQLTISVNNQEFIGSVVSIKNMTGQLIAEEKVNALTQSVDLGQIAQGIYLVTISNKSGSATKKLIIN